MPARAGQAPRVPAGLAALALAVGLIVSAALVSRSLERIKLAGDKITVKGYAEEQVVSDAGTWRGTVTVRAADLQAGYRLLEADTARVLQLLEALDHRHTLCRDHMAPSQRATLEGLHVQPRWQPTNQQVLRQLLLHQIAYLRACHCQLHDANTGSLHIGHIGGPGGD